MMQGKVYKIPYDIKRGVITYEVFNFTSEDNGSCQFDFTILDKDVAYNLTGTIVRLVAKSPSGVTIQQDCTVATPTSGKASIVLLQSFFNGEGKHIAELQIYNSTDQTLRLSLPQFMYKVKKSLMDDNTAEADPNFSILQNMIINVSNANTTANTALSTANSALTNANAAVTTINNQIANVNAAVDEVEGIVTEWGPLAQEIQNKIVMAEVLPDVSLRLNNTFYWHKTASGDIDYVEDYLGNRTYLTQEVKQRMTTVENLVQSVIDTDITAVLESEIIATDIANKLNQKEIEYSPRLTNTETQLANMEKQVRTEKINLSGYNNSLIRPLVTFVSDDGNRADLEMLALFNSKNIKGCTAMISAYIGQGNYMTGSELQQLNTSGWDIMLHDTHHRYMNTLSEDQLNASMKTGKETIEALGIPCKGLATPYGATSSLVKKVSEKYFDYCFGENIGRTNNQPIISYDLERVNHGAVGQTMTHYKNAVNRAIAEKGWVVFCTHYYQLSVAQKDEMAELIDWIKAQNVDIVNMTEGMKVFGNVQEYRNYDTDEYFCLAKSGKTFANGINNYSFKPIGDVNNETPISGFDFDKTTIMNFSGITLGFPVNAGTLETYRDRYLDFNTYCYQKITPVFGSDNHIRYRQWDKANAVWKSWNKININLTDRCIVDTVNGKTNSSLPSAYTPNAITYTTISGANALDFPSARGGTLETNRINSTDNGYQFQRYYETGLTRVWYRVTTSGGAWSNWRQDCTQTKITASTLVTNVPAKSTVQVVVSTSGLTYDSSLSVVPKGDLPIGIMFNALVHNNLNNTILRFANVTDVAISVPALDWTILYTV